MTKQITEAVIREYALTRHDVVQFNKDGSLTVADQCYRCGGTGVYTWWAQNGKARGDCFGCDGKGQRVKTLKNAVRWYKSRQQQDKKNAEQEIARVEKAAAARKAALPELWVRAILKMRLVAGKAEAQSKKGAASNWVGEVGDKIEMPVKVTFTRRIDTYYGPSLLIRMVTQRGGYEVVAFYSGQTEFEKGDEFVLTGKVKKLEEYKEVKQTVVTRIKRKELTNA